MTRSMSRARRVEAFLQDALQMYDTLEDWYDAYPEAALARSRRRPASDGVS